MAFANDPTYAAGDRVLVFENSGIAALSEHPTALANGGNPRPATVLRQHPDGPDTVEVQYTDAMGGGELITDTQRLRHLAHVAQRLAKVAAEAQATSDEAARHAADARQRAVEAKARTSAAQQAAEQ